ncbi:CBS domain-containing protein [Chrysiogenes arsenatis]|uniref:CBS domain-containing protein n=1 Tax=Chrysiogenes arsenatis TaxID=309797 RepID=UPI0003F7EA7E|nr:CBS domain-containing protein [Chrysiogenes arsenatis]
MALAKDIMTTNPIVVSDTLSIQDAARLLLEKNISGAPVVDDTGKMVGIITKKDIVDTVREMKLPRLINIFDAIIYLESAEEYNHELNKMAAVCVSDAMTKKVITVSPDMELPRLASLLSEHHINMVPVTHGEGKLLGIVSTTDVLKAVAYGSNQS